MIQQVKLSNEAILNQADHLSDEEWREMIIRSVENTLVDGLELPGYPSEEFQRGTVGSHGVHAVAFEGYAFYRLIKQYAAQLGLSLNRNSSILDFGCGWGRMIRFFLKDIDARNLYGVDVDPAMVKTCTDTVRYGNYSLVNSIPPTQFADNSLDVIYAYSVFSHLAEPTHIQWIQEFARILKPNGLLLVTTQARRFLEYVRSLQGQEHEFHWHQNLAKSFLDIDAAYADYDAGKFLFSATGGGETRDASFYGEALIPKAYVEREWTKYLQFRDFVDDANVLPQSLIVMQKHNLAQRPQVDNHAILNSVSRLTDQQWFDMLLSSAVDPTVNGLHLPGFPSAELQLASVGASGEAALQEAFQFYQEVKDYAAACSHVLTPQSRLLDFGCGWGRMTRFFLKDIAAQSLYGIDIDPSMIQVCQQLFPAGQFEVNAPQTPTRFPDDYFDVICAYSVFSHLAEPVHLQWIKEFARILKPGGLLVANTRPRSWIAVCDSLRQQADLPSDYHRGLANSFLDAEAAYCDYDNGSFLYSPVGGGGLRDGEVYGEALVSPGYVKQHWSQYLSSIDFVDNAEHLLALIVVQKPGESAGSQVHAADPNALVRRNLSGVFSSLERVPYAWNINQVSIIGSRLEVSGWALPIGGNASRTEFYVEGQPVQANYPLGSDLSELYPYWPGAESTGFSLSVEAWSAVPGQRSVEIALQDKASNQFLSAYQRFYWPTSLRLAERLPPESLRKHIGSLEKVPFILTGYSLYRNFDLACQQFTGRSIHQFPAILDWGCGCGRVVRNLVFENEQRSKITAIDIDSAAIEWCQQNIAGVQFAQVPLFPPTQLAADSIDLVYAYSVMTHLTEAAQFQWLAELRRITRPGGLLLLTIMSDVAVLNLWRGNLPDWFDRWRASGFDDGLSNSDLDTAIADQEYYRNSFHTKQYIQEHWSKDFKILGIVDSFHFYQSLVVLQRKD